jgi:hypothetical protein
LALVSSVEVHLPATGLGWRKDDFLSKPLKQRNGGAADVRVERIGEARDEEGDAHGI